MPGESRDRLLVCLAHVHTILVWGERLKKNDEPLIKIKLFPSRTREIPSRLPTGYCGCKEEGAGLESVGRHWKARSM